MAHYRFYIEHRGDEDQLGLAAMLREYAKLQPVPDHFTEEQAASLVLRRYVELIESEIKQIEIRATREGDEPATGVDPVQPPPDAPF